MQLITLEAIFTLLLYFSILTLSLSLNPRYICNLYCHSPILSNILQQVFNNILFITYIYTTYSGEIVVPDYILPDDCSQLNTERCGWTFLIIAWLCNNPLIQFRCWITHNRYNGWMLCFDWIDNLCIHWIELATFLYLVSKSDSINSFESIYPLCTEMQKHHI